MKKLFFITLSLVFSLTTMAQDFMTIGEVFDFEIGDEFQITGNGEGQTPNADRITILDKYYSNDSDSVFYVRFHNSYETYLENSTLHYHFWTETDTVFYTDLDSSITSSNYWVSYDTSMISYDTINSISEDYCDSLVNGYQYSVNSFEPVYYSGLYGKGLGLVDNYYYNPAEYMMYDNVLFYYKKNGIGCGTPDTTLVSIPENKLINDFKITPNPADTYFNISNKAGGQFDVKIYTITGELIISQSFETNNSYFDCSSLNPGLYIVCFSRKSNRYLRKLIIK